MTSANPYYQNLDGSGANQQILFNYGPYGASREESSSFDSWGITPELKITFANDWQLRTMLNYGESNSDYFQPSTDSVLMSQYGSAPDINGAINYYDLASTANQSLITNTLNSYSYGKAESKIANARVIVDGALYSLPGGEVRVALGAEYMDEKLSRREGSYSSSTPDTSAWQSYDRDITAFFGELQIPIIGERNSLPGVQSFDLSLSVRHDDYSDFGETTNPKIGISYVPVEWITVRASWGESFNAPTPVDQLSSQFNTFDIFPFVAVRNPADDPVGAESQTVAVQGAQPDLQPQTATTWSAGFDIEPPALSGFRASLNYYEIEFEGTLNKPPAFNPTELYTNFSDYAVVHPSDADLVAAANFAVGGAQKVAPLLGTGTVYNIIYFLTDNLGNTNISGLDFAFNQLLDTSFGSVDLGLSGNYRLESETQLSSGTPWIDDLEYDEPEYFVKLSAGTNIGQLRAQLDYNYRDGYDVVETAQRPQSKVKEFGTLDMYFRYDFMGGSGWSEDLSLTMNINNVLDEEPPVYKQAGDDGYANGFSLGRLVKVGFSKRL